MNNLLIQCPHLWGRNLDYGSITEEDRIEKFDRKVIRLNVEGIQVEEGTASSMVRRNNTEKLLQEKKVQFMRSQ